MAGQAATIQTNNPFLPSAAGQNVPVPGLFGGASVMAKPPGLLGGAPAGEAKFGIQQPSPQNMFQMTNQLGGLGLGASPNNINTGTNGGLSSSLW